MRRADETGLLMHDAWVHVMDVASRGIPPRSTQPHEQLSVLVEGMHANDTISIGLGRNGVTAIHATFRRAHRAT